MVSGEYSHIRDTNPRVYEDENIDSESEISYIPLFASPVTQEGMQLVGEKSENGIEWQFANTVHDMPVGTKLYAMLNASKDGV